MNVEIEIADMCPIYELVTGISDEGEKNCTYMEAIT